MTGGRVLPDALAQGHLDTWIDHGPAAEATRRHLSESAIQDLRLIVRDLCRARPWTADQGVEAHPRIVVAGLLTGRGPFRLASEVVA